MDRDEVDARAAVHIGLTMMTNQYRELKHPLIRLMM
jgi:hypothetical protein